MSIALFVAFVEVGLLLVYPYVSELFANGARTFSIPEYLFLCLGSDMSKVSDRLRSAGYTRSAADAVTYFPLVIFIVLIICAVLALIVAAAKKNKAAGIIQVIGGTVALVATILLSATLTIGEDAVALPANIVVTDKLGVLIVLMIAFGAFAIVNPDASLGSKATAAPAMMAPSMQRGAYPQVNAAPMRQPVYNTPAPAPAPAPVPAPAPAAPAPAPAASPAPITATYTCPICSTTQKSDLAFCTFCGNPNPNK